MKNLETLTSYLIKSGQANDYNEIKDDKNSEIFEVYLIKSCVDKSI